MEVTILFFLTPHSPNATIITLCCPLKATRTASFYRFQKVKDQDYVIFTSAYIVHVYTLNLYEVHRCAAVSSSSVYLHLSYSVLLSV